MLLSIIIPFYNAMPYLVDLLKSIEYQKLTNAEIIFINDGSTDDFETILNPFIEKNKNTRLISTTNKGVAHAKNTGLSYANGDYVWFVDADDMMCSNAIQNIIQKIETCNNSIDIFFSKFRILDSKTNIISDVPYNYAPLLKEIANPKSATVDLMDLLFSKININFAIWYQLFRREFLIQKKIQFDETLLVSEDLDFKIKTIANTQYVDVVDEYIYVYRTPSKNRNSLTVKKHTGDDLVPVANMFLKWYRFFDLISNRISGQEIMRKKTALLFYLHFKHIQQEPITIITKKFIEDNENDFKILYESNKTYIDSILQQLHKKK